MIEVTNISQLKSLLEEKNTQELYLLKHSTRCPTSSMALAAFERFSSNHPDIFCGFIKVIEHRDVSNLISEITDVVHQSPQVFLFKNGELLWNASHYDIQEDSLESHLNSDS